MYKDKICIVLVTYNRLNKLKKAIASYENQTSLPNAIIVIDNNSNDGTVEFLKNWVENQSIIERKVFFLSSNLGGAGGFKKGIEEAIKYDYDWIYISDDDAYLDKYGIKHFRDIESSVKDKYNAICGMVTDDSGILLNHRRNIKFGLLTKKEINSTDLDYDKDSFDIKLFSFVGSFIKKDVILKNAPIRDDYFIWYDDTEYSYRLTKDSSALCYPKIKVFHDCPRTEVGFCWKSYYGYRNEINMLHSNCKYRYYLTFKFSLFISSIFDCFRNKKKGKVKREAIKDEKRGKFGKNEKYLPIKKS